MIIYVGDLHGRVEILSKIDIWATNHNVNTVVQVGDFGAFWPGEEDKINRYFMKRARQKRRGATWIVSPGNHDNWDHFNSVMLGSQDPEQPLFEMSPGLFYARRGGVVNIEGISHLFFGGATSTDRHLRTEGKNWWAKESPSTNEFQQFFDAFDAGGIDVVVTHEAPSCVPMRRISRDRDPVACGMENVIKCSVRRPKRWFFGHHHMKFKSKIEEIDFACCGVHGDFAFFDGNEITYGRP